MAPIIEFLQAQAITAALFLRKVLLWFLLPSWVRSGLEYIRTPAAAKFIKTSCIASSITLICAGVPEMVEIIRRKSSSHRSLTPFCCMIIDSIIGLWFSVSISDALGTRLRVLGIVMTVGYLSVMVVYARKPRESLGYVVATLVLVASFCGSIVAFVPREKWLDILGVANSLTAVMFAASPLADIGRVLKSRDASSLPFFMVTMLTVCATSWALYGVILQNIYMVLPNMFNALIGGLQVLLCLMFPGTKTAKLARGAVHLAERKWPTVRNVAGVIERELDQFDTEGLRSPPGQVSTKEE